jgi:two-component system sensor histidine kinase YesM
MKKNNLFYKTLTFKLLLYCFCLVLLLTSFFSWLFYSSAKEKYEREAKESVLMLHTNANYGIENNLAQVSALNTVLSANTKITAFLSDNGKDKIRNMSYALSAVTEAKMLLNTTSISGYVPKMLLTSDRNSRYIQIGLFYGQITDRTAFEKLCPEELAGPSFSYPITVNPFNPEFYGQYKPEQILPLRFPVSSYATNKKIGTFYIALDTAILKDPLKGLEESFILLGDQLYKIENTHFSPLDFDVKQFDALAPNSHLVSKEYKELYNGTVFLTKSKSGVVLISPLKALHDDIFVPDFNFFFPAFSLLFFLVFFWYLLLNKLVNKPVKIIYNQVSKMIKADYEVSPAFTGISEFEEISTHINELAGAFQLALNQLKEEETLKRNYKFRLLQNQIHPHFIYNTLNSIRWLGQMNSVPPIVDMTTSLSNMMRAVFKNNSEWFRVEEELNFMKEYIHLQSFRYADMFTPIFDIPDPEVLSASVLRFTLQPLVENALFHGIGPAGRKCELLIGVYRESEDLIFVVKDNGVGLNVRSLDEITRETEKTDRLSGIGIQNIHQRIQMEFGDQYGLNIESILGEFTKVTVIMPLIYKKP